MTIQQKPIDDILEEFELSERDLPHAPSADMFGHVAPYIVVNGKAYLSYFAYDASPIDPLAECDSAELIKKCDAYYAFLATLGRNEYGEIDPEIVEQELLSNLWIPEARNSMPFAEHLLLHRDAGCTAHLTADCIEDAAREFIKNGDGEHYAFPCYEAALSAAWKETIQCLAETKHTQLVQLDYTGEVSVDSALNIFDLEKEPDAVWVPGEEIVQRIESLALSEHLVGQVVRRAARLPHTLYEVVLDEPEQGQASLLFDTEEQAQKHLASLCAEKVKSFESQEDFDAWLDEPAIDGLRRRYYTQARAGQKIAEQYLASYQHYRRGECYYTVAVELENSGTDDEPVWEPTDNYMSVGGYYGDEYAASQLHELLKEFIPAPETAHESAA